MESFCVETVYCFYIPTIVKINIPTIVKIRCQFMKYGNENENW